MNGFKGKFTSIKDISDRRRLPRLGKIRLGVKVKHKTKPDLEYPRETDYFVCPEEVQKVFGEHPKELPIMFPIEDREIIFPQAYKYYGQSKGLKCIGDGETAMRVNEEGEFSQVDCLCELLNKKACQRRAHLMVIIPKVSVGGVYQIDLGSYHSIVDINSGIDYIRAMVGRFSWVPLILKRVPRETHGGEKKTTHYTLQVEFQGDIETINLLREDTKRILEGPRYALPAPIDENPKFDNGATIEYTDDEENGQQERTSEAESQKASPKMMEIQDKRQKQILRPIGEFPLLFTTIPNQVIDTSLHDVEKLLPKQLTIDQVNRVLALLKGKPINRDEFVGKVADICKIKE